MSSHRHLTFLHFVPVVHSQNLKDTKNKYVSSDSHTVSQSEIPAVFEDVTGEKWKVTKKATDEEITKANEELVKGNLLAGYDLVKALNFGPGSKGDGTVVEGGLWNERLGLPKEDLKESVKSVLGTGGTEAAISHLILLTDMIIYNTFSTILTLFSYGQG
jgi:hypothetical protein